MRCFTGARRPGRSRARDRCIEVFVAELAERRPWSRPGRHLGPLRRSRSTRGLQRRSRWDRQPRTGTELKTPPLPADSLAGMAVSPSRSARRGSPGPAPEPARVPHGPRRILFFGTYDARRYQSVRVLRDGLAALGHEIVECNEPLNVSTAERVRMLRQPWRLPVFAFRLLAAWARLWRHARRMPASDAVVVGYMGHFDVHLARRLFPDATIVLDHLVFARDTAADRRA